ncbi:DEAD/DEAH box helicase [Rhodococcus tukisamuensis]|uniref:Superfamily II DNA or RNA helicase, SNF2 family n=1 Tax=Rhodococcus tukisamuensis TaxID=168276 RepID=A0A1G7D6Q8_9NOCA|nr:DEAD/DEAH box helicase [Rhodococcus tukisamuensis]SDE46680.1 Superfamily II DNA or RNA helicase, SNF2 family [Rhodococcus tukisamuensis]
MVHALWTPGSGLLLWRDAGAAEPDLDTDELPEALQRALARKFRHRVTVSLPNGDGTLADVTVPALALAPDAAAELLLNLSLGPVAGAAAVSGDLRFLAHVARGIHRWSRAGRVVPDLQRADGQWWVRWQLVGGERQRAWVSELAVAMPPVLRVSGGGRKALEDLIFELTDPIVRRMLGNQSAAHPGAHPMLLALATETPFEEGTQQIANELQQWRSTLAVDEPELVLRLIEPEDDGADQAGPAGAADGQDPDPLWRLEVCLRPTGEAPVPVPVHLADPDAVRMGMRKLGEAMTAYPRLRGLPSDPRNLDLLLPLAVVTDLVAHGARELAEAGITMLLPRAWSVVAPSLRLRVTSPSVLVDTDDRAVGLNQLVAYNWELALGDVVLTSNEMAELTRTKSDLVKLRGQWVQAQGGALADAIAYVTRRGSGDDSTLADLLGELAVHDAPPIPVDEITSTGWVAGLLDSDVAPVRIPVPPGLEATLRPYQRRGLDWLAYMSGLGLGGILADDMGLGKTVQLLALLAHEQATGAEGPTLLVCPMSVVGNWQREAARFTPGLRVHVHHGADRLRGDDLGAVVTGHDLVVTTYALLARDVEVLRELHWRRVVLDEAQHIKNSATAQARAARAVPAAHRLALTGTPVENRLDELRSILDFANPRMLGSPQQFRARFAIPIERSQDKAALARLQAVTSPFVLRRVKTDPEVISDLPEKFEMTVRANLTAEQAALYKAVLDDMMAKLKDKEGVARKGAVLAALTRLKQVCNHPAHFLGDGSSVLRRGRHRSGKLGLVEDIVDSVLADGERVLLFTQFREFGAIVAPYLAERFGTEVPFLHGGVTRGRRDAMVHDFQAGGSSAPIMLLSLKAGGTGLNLTAANHVVHLDRWWNPAVENQATDRAFRIGQRRDVQVRKLVCVGTLEERIDAMLGNKAELADLAVQTGENWITEMSNEELRALMTLGDEAVGE